MARTIKFDPPREDIPAWFLTYSDVITLLMTFFILLLTFATTEPESFERIQSSMFGGGGGSGFAGKQGEHFQDAIISRIRPRSARMTQRGSESPPIDTETTTESLGKGLKSMTEEPEHNVMESQELKTELILMVDQQGVTPLGQQRLQMMARQLKTGPFELTFCVHRDRELASVYAMVAHLNGLGVAPQATAIEFQPAVTNAEKSLTIRWIRRTGE